jgi:hypothetical protein
MLTQPPGHLVERRSGTTSPDGRISIPIARGAAGTYIICIVHESSQQGVYVARGAVNGMVNGSVVGRYDFGGPNTCGRFVSFFLCPSFSYQYHIQMSSIQIWQKSDMGMRLRSCAIRPAPNTMVWHLDRNATPRSFVVNCQTNVRGGRISVSLYCAAPGTPLPSGSAWRPSDWIRH